MNVAKRRFVWISAAAMAVVFIVVASWFIYRLRKLDIREAYAAWDTGELLIAYMRENDDRWPGSWEDLHAFLQGEHGDKVAFRGTHTGDRQRIAELRQRMAIDWSFDPAAWKAGGPDRAGLRVVTRADGQDFHTLWQNAEPNEMIRQYLARDDLIPLR